MEKEIEIPEGYEARIESNKVIIEPMESEDEKIRKWLISYIKNELDDAEFTAGGAQMAYNAIAWLEKQKEQKPTEWSDEDKRLLRTTLECLNYVSCQSKTPVVNWLNSLPKRFNLRPKQEWSENFDKEVMKVHKLYPEVSFAKLTRIAYHFSKWTNERKDIKWSEEDIKKIRSEEYTKGFNDAAFGGKLKEWSEEDDNIIEQIIMDYEGEIIRLSNSLMDKPLRPIYQKRIDFLESLRPQPHWKPSDK